MTDHLPPTDDWLSFVEPLVAMANDAMVEVGAITARPDLAAAFVAGSVALAAGARLCLLAATIVAIAWAVNHWEIVHFDPAAEPLLAAVASVLFLLGLAQGLLTVLAGEEAAGTALGALVFGAIAFILLRGPGRLIALLVRRR